MTDRPTLYPAADHTSQWYAERHPGVTMELREMALVLHTTEGVGWWDYSGGSEAPTFTLWHGHGIRQHFPVNMSARALVHKAGTTPTNTQDCVQIELVGTCDKATARKYGTIYWPEATDAQLSELAHLVLWLHQNWGLKLNAAPKWLRYPASAGNSAARFTSAEWLAFEGVAGHQHIPGNDHGDPGDFPVARLFALVGQLAGTHTATPTSNHAAAAAAVSAPKAAAYPAKPFSHAVLMAGIAASAHGSASGNVKLYQLALRAMYPDSGNTIDGVWRSGDKYLTARMQRDMGWKLPGQATGIPGTASTAKLFEQPAVIRALKTAYYLK